jgi:hypothetical protein
MKHNVMLTIASLLSILFMTFHLTDDIIRGMEKGGVSNLVAVPILVLWLYGTLVLAERRSGYVIILVGSLLGLAVPVIHMLGKGVGGRGGGAEPCWAGSRCCGYGRDRELVAKSAAESVYKGLGKEKCCKSGGISGNFGGAGADLRPLRALRMKIVSPRV